MKAVYKNELSTYFTTLTGYVFSAFLLCVCYPVPSGRLYDNTEKQKTEIPMLWG